MVLDRTKLSYDWPGEKIPPKNIDKCEGKQQFP